MSAFINLGMYDNSGFDRGAPRWKRGLWVLVRWVFFQNPCPWRSAFRSALLSAFGAKIGKGVCIGSNVNISFPWRLAVGDHVWIGDDVGILSLAQVTIESNVCVARRSVLVPEPTIFGGKISSSRSRVALNSALLQLLSSLICGTKHTLVLVIINSNVTHRNGSFLSSGFVVLPKLSATLPLSCYLSHRWRERGWSEMNAV